jgi:hypothetical protein
MTYLELCVATRQECGIQGETPAAVTNQRGLLKRIVDWVADADVVVQSVYADWDFLWAEFTDDTTDNSDAITKPTNFGMWDRESFAVDRGTATGRKLTVYDFKEWRNANYLKIKQEPSRITITPDGNLRLSQPANGTYEIYANYWKDIIRMSINADTPPYPTRFHRIVICRAAMFFFKDQEAWQNYTEAEKEYMFWLDELKGYAAPGQQFRTQAEAIPMAASAQ